MQLGLFTFNIQCLASLALVIFQLNAILYEAWKLMFQGRKCKIGGKCHARGMRVERYDNN